MSNENLFDKLKATARETFVKLIKDQKRILISDTTLRDGEQAPGASLTAAQKLLIAKQLDRLGVDSIDAGFPASGKGEFDAAKIISKEVRRPVISALSRCLKKDIEITADCFGDAKHWGISLFLGTSPMLRKYSLNKSKDEIVGILKDAIKFAKKFTDNVSFGAEDATRTETDFLYKVYEEAIDSGATVIGFTDTVGWLIPEQTKEMIGGIRKNVKNFKKALLAIHFHDDLGLAVANSLAAVECGVNVVQCTINGLGERAGNTSLEELVMALRTRKDYYGAKTNINTQELFRTSCLVSELTGQSVSSNKSIVGQNVFATEAGIHQAALLKNRLTYEIVKPEDVGQKGTTIVLGKHSGKHALANRMEKLGIRFPEKEKNEKLEVAYKHFKEMTLTKKIINDEDLKFIADELRKGK